MAIKKLGGLKAYLKIGSMKWQIAIGVLLTVLDSKRSADGPLG